jgi:hypothetical protein
MKTLIAVLLSISFSVLLLIIVASMTCMSILDREATVKNMAISQVQVVEAEFDKMWKVIEQKTQVTKASKEQQKALVDSLVQGRSGSFIKLIHESNPESAFSQEQFTSLSNSIEAQRESFLAEQVKMIDFYRQHDTMFDTVTSGFVLNFANRDKLDPIVVISSDKTKMVMSSGEDNDVNLSL